MSDDRQTLLIVDDESNVLRSLKRLLFETDYRVLTAESGDEGLKMFENESSIQLVVSDYRMPEMNGVEFLKRVKELHPDTIRIILSGYADVIAIVEAINDGQVYKFISKPWNDQDLLTTVMRAFEQYSLVQENRHLNEELLKRNKELEDVAQELERKVQERTKDLGMKNRALAIAHRILDLLPAGVVGIDPETSVVYSNEKAHKYLGAGKLSLQGPADRAFEPDVLANIVTTVSSQQVYRDTIQGTCKLGLIARPLPDGGGVICLLVNETGLGLTTELSAVEVEESRAKDV